MPQNSQSPNTHMYSTLLAQTIRSLSHALKSKLIDPLSRVSNPVCSFTKLATVATLGLTFLWSLGGLISVHAGTLTTDFTSGYPGATEYFKAGDSTTLVKDGIHELDLLEIHNPEDDSIREAILDTLRSVLERSDVKSTPDAARVAQKAMFLAETAVKSARECKPESARSNSCMIRPYAV